MKLDVIYMLLIIKFYKLISRFRLRKNQSKQPNNSKNLAVLHKSYYDNWNTIFHTKENV